MEHLLLRALQAILRATARHLVTDDDVKSAFYEAAWAIDDRYTR